MKKLVFVVGARPNFVKVRPLIDCCEKKAVPYAVLNTNQHDKNMQVGGVSGDFVNVYAGNRVERWAQMMTAFRNWVVWKGADVVVVVGDTDTSATCALAASMTGIPVAHVEAGMRSFYPMPEEANRILIDQVSTWRLAASSDAVENLSNEKLSSTLVGNVSVESLLRYWKPSENRLRNYILVEIHRPENDRRMRDLLEWAANAPLPVQWIMHPRHQKSGAYRPEDNVVYISPQNYEQGLDRTYNAALLVTDSGGMQVDAAVLGTPCITVRKNTEWRVTLERGANVLVPDIANLGPEVHKRLSREPRTPDFRDQLWDDGVSSRILSEILV